MSSLCISCCRKDESGGLTAAASGCAAACRLRSCRNAWQELMRSKAQTVPSAAKSAAAACSCLDSARCSLSARPSWSRRRRVASACG